MCGIAGFVGRFDPELLQRMNDVQSHRGPDDSGVFSLPDKYLGLAHRRLSIIDLESTGHQPMHDATGTATIIFNGEIYNYRELREDLQSDGFHFLGHSDTEVLLNLYLRDGRQMLESLNGIFAFALWDHRDSTLFLARDGLGVKPLYFAELSDGFLFASEMKAILQSEAVPRTIDPVAVQHYLTYLWCPAPRTMLKAVHKLEPGWALLVSDGAEQDRWCFYDLPYDGPPPEIDEAEAISDTETAVRRAVERQLVADVPVGAFLSGGLDSSAVATFASQALGGRRLQCFTIGFTDDTMAKVGHGKDLPYAKKVAEHLGVDLHTVFVGSEMIDLLESMIYHLDEPQADPAAINVMLISELAREKGIKVLLSGVGGDDIFSGYRRHKALIHEWAWEWMPQSARMVLQTAARSASQRRQLGRRTRKAFGYASYTGDRRIASYFSWIEPERLIELYGTDLERSLENVDPLAPLLQSLERLPNTVQRLDRMLYLEGKHFLADHNLNYTDKMGMAMGVEIRVPLLDTDLVATATALPRQLKYRGREGKRVLRKAMEPYLPQDVIHRSKVGFGAPLREWLQGPLRPNVSELLSEQSVARRGLFDSKSVGRFIELDRRGGVDGSYTIFALLCIELWCRIFVDAPIPKAGS